MRAYWLVQNWIFDALRHQQEQEQLVEKAECEVEEDEEMKECEPAIASATKPRPCELVASEIYLGDHRTTFSLANAHECTSQSCRHTFLFLEDGIYVCQRHGSPHICTFEQCDRKELSGGRYVCWVSGHTYGYKQEDVGTGTRVRRVMFTDRHGDSSAIEMEVPVMLPLGQVASYLLEGGPKSAMDRTSNSGCSLSPPPPAQKVWGYDEADGQGEQVGSPSRMAAPARRARTVASFKREREDELSPSRARIRRRLNERVDPSDPSFYVYLQVPQAVANLPRVALELQEPQVPVVGNGPPVSPTTTTTASLNILPVRVQPRYTLNYLKEWMEDLSGELISRWDQQFFWSDTLIGDEAKVMTLQQHGISDGVLLELRLHDDCPLLVGDWTGKQTMAGEYNTVQISKEAEEDLDEEQDELENVIAVEEASFQQDRLERKRLRMEQVGAIHHTEVLEYQGTSTVSRLVGVIAEQPGEWKKLGAATRAERKTPTHLKATRMMDKDALAMKQVADSAQPLTKKKKQ